MCLRHADRVLLVDTMGELEAFFSLADVVFLGGSLTPVGGHNVLEPAAAGCPVLVGPHLETCRREAEILAAGGGLEVVPDEAALSAILSRLLASPADRERMGSAARESVLGLSGAAEAKIAFPHFSVPPADFASGASRKLLFSTLLMRM